jgi:hypothetical protein
LKRVCFVIFVALSSSTFSFSVDGAISQVDPKEAARQRQAEIAWQMFCNEKAARENGTKRDVGTFVARCMDAIERADQIVRNSQRRVHPAPVDGSKN